MYKARVHTEVTPSLDNIKTVRLIPITDDLTESKLIAQTDESHADEVIIMGTIGVLLERYGQSVTPPSPTPNMEASPH